MYPTTGLSYYRLEQIDIDGRPTNFLPVPVFVENNQQKSGSVNIYPNPVQGNANLIYASNNNQPVTVTIADLTGRILSSTVFTLVKIGENVFKLNTGNLSRGLYQVYVRSNQKSYNLKCIKL